MTYKELLNLVTFKEYATLMGRISWLRHRFTQEK